MKVLLAIACLMAVGFAQPRDPLPPGARRGSFLFNIQTKLSAKQLKYFPDGGNWTFPDMVTSRLQQVTDDFCRINNANVHDQSQKSMFFGTSCKAAFVKLYKQEDQCGGVFCDVILWVKSNLNSVLISLIEATTDEEAFGIIEEQIVNPIMEYNCKCSNKMMDAWMGCKENISEASFWSTLQSMGGYNTTAAYLDGRDFKEYWVHTLVNRLPWRDLETMLERTITNLCQDNTQGEGQCYTYFYDTVTTLYRWYLISDGQRPSVKKGKKNKSPYDASCSEFDLSLAYDETISFDAIKEALVERFCVDECSGLYQEVLLGCCSASMIEDEELEVSIKNSAQTIKDIFVSVYRNKTETATEKIDEYFGYYDDVMEMLRDPTCDNGVSYDVTPCDQNVEGRTDDPCAEITNKKKKKKCMKKNKGGKGGKKKGNIQGSLFLRCPVERV